MKIYFSKREYRQLLDLIYLGDWVVASHLETEKSPYESLRNKIYSHAHDFGFDELIVHDKHANAYYETASFEEQGVTDYIDAYNRCIMEQDDIL